MPSGTGVVDAFKNLIRHGKHHQAAAQADGKYLSEDTLHSSDSSPRGNQKQQQQSTPKQIPADMQSVDQQQSPDHREAAEMIVSEEREAKTKMPTYVGLENFKLLDKMGDGAFSNVYKAIDLTTGKKVAVKVVRKYELNASQAGDKHLNEKFKRKPRVTERANILKEVQIMRGTNHPSIVRLISFSESPDHYYIVLELMDGGELFHQIVKLTYFSENLSRHVILQVAHGIRYLHEERGVVHRDIKPENLLFDRIPIIPAKHLARRPYDEEKEDEGEFIPGVGGGGIGRVKIADFGLSKVVWNEETMTPCGTVGYTAPEIVKDERYSKSVDMWALGCVLYTLLCGFPPFYDESINVLTEKVARGHYTFLSPWWDDISHTAKDLIQHLLCVDPAQRYTIDEFLAHKWCNAAPAPLPPPTPNVYSSSAPLDSPLLTAVHGGRVEGRSPGIATLKEAFDITYAVHRMEEEGARRRAYNGRGGAGPRGFLAGLNEDNEDEEEDKEVEETRRKHGDAAGRAVQEGGRQIRYGASSDSPANPGRVSGAMRGGADDKVTLEGGRAGQRDRGGRTNVGVASSRTGAGRGFELDMDGATLLGRRHRKGGFERSPLAGKPIWSGDKAEDRLPPGSPMRIT